VRSVASPVVMSPVSSSVVCRHTPSIAYRDVISGMRVTVETPVLKSPMTGVDWPHNVVGDTFETVRGGVQSCRQGPLGTPSVCSTYVWTWPGDDTSCRR
jgi:hypothetical protein